MTISRRLALAATAAGLLVPLPAKAQTLIEIAQLGTAIANAADAVGKLAENITKALNEGLKIWDISSARLARDSTIKLSKDLARFSSGANMPFISELEYFIQGYRHAKPSQAEARALAWGEVKTKMSDVLQLCAKILSDLDQDDSKLVATPIYADLMTTLRSRALIVSRLAKIPTPTTQDEFDALVVVAGNYRILMANLRKALDALNIYIAKM